MNVLIATDGSEVAVDAAHTAIKLLHPDAHVALAMVVEPRQDPMADAGGFEGPLITDEQADREWDDTSRAATAELAKEAADAGTPVDTRMVPDDRGPAHGIIKAAAEVGADVIVIGASGKGAFRRLFSGSVSDQVVHHATCPVLVVPHPKD